MAKEKEAKVEVKEVKKEVVKSDVSGVLANKKGLSCVKYGAERLPGNG